MKTVLIFDQCGEAPIEFYVLKGDYSRLADVYVNSTEADEALADELNDLFYDAEGKKLLKPKKRFPVNAVKNGALVITCGFLP